LFTLHVDAWRWNGRRTSDATALALDPVARPPAGHNEDHGGAFMIRRFWPVLVVLVLACVAMAALLLRKPEPPPVAKVDQAVEATPAPQVKPTTPATKAVDGPTREPAGYDHYRAEMKRIRAEREKAQALEANERCIGGERYRKVGSAWERSGNC
jgi:hypothetical protein